MPINLNELSYKQLQTLDNSLEEFLFKQPSLGDEPFSPTFRKDPKTFRKLISLMVSFKRDLMKLFTRMYENRWQLMNYHTVNSSSLYIKFDQYDQYFYSSEWDFFDQELAQVIEEHRKKAYGIGLLSLAVLMGLGLSITPEDAQKQITNISLKMASAINKVTRDRIKKQIEASLKLNETRADFEQRLKSVLQNQTRARLIAEDQALNSWSQARVDLATENEMKYRTLTGFQTDRSEMCGEIIGQTVPIDQPYSNGLMHPQFHIRCRCAEEFSNSNN